MRSIHECAVTTCATRIPAGELLCLEHVKPVPFALRERIARLSQEMLVSEEASAAYRAAVREAIALAEGGGRDARD